MLSKAIPSPTRHSQIATVGHRLIKLDPVTRNELELYLSVELDLDRLENGPFTVIFTRDDGALGHDTFAFRGHTVDNRRLAIAIDDEAHAFRCDVPAHLQELQRRLPADLADAIVLLTKRGLERSGDVSPDRQALDQATLTPSSL